MGKPLMEALSPDSGESVSKRRRFPLNSRPLQILPFHNFQNEPNEHFHCFTSHLSPPSTGSSSSSSDLAEIASSSSSLSWLASPPPSRDNCSSYSFLSRSRLFLLFPPLVIPTVPLVIPILVVPPPPPPSSCYPDPSCSFSSFSLSRSRLFLLLLPLAIPTVPPRPPSSDPGCSSSSSLSRS